MKLSQKQAMILIGIVAVVILVVVVFFISLRPAPTSTTQGKLSVWGIENKAQFVPIIAGYPYATITYTQIDPANYQAQLLQALAAGDGPDVIEIGDHSLSKWLPVLAPMPAAYATQYGQLWLGNAFPDVVAQDFVASGTNIYALPLSIDTLAMIYNKDLFNSAGIAVSPTTWDEFEADVLKLRTLNAQGQITQAAAALGGSETSISNAPDLLSLLMLQNGTQMVNDNQTSATFASQSESGSSDGLAAFNFYLQFADASAPYYTWNDTMGNAIDSFAAGKTAIIFGYQSDLATIEQKAPFLNVGVAAMPQPTGATININYANYEGFAATKAGQSALAWNFILYLTASDANEKLYLSATGKPPAMRTEIAADQNDPSLSVFANQALTADSWTEPDDVQVGNIFNTAIVNVLNGTDDSTDALNQAQSAVSALMNQ